MKKQRIPEGSEWFTLLSLDERFYAFTTHPDTAVCADQYGKVIALATDRYGDIEFRAFCDLSQADLITVFTYLIEEIGD